MYVDINNPSNWKSCRLKQYEVWACRPPVGTVVIDKLIFPQVVQNLHGKDFFTVAELYELRQSNQQFIAQLQSAIDRGIAQVVQKGDYVISGTRGELNVLNWQCFEAWYKCFVNGVWSNDWQSVTSEKTVFADGQYCVDWVKAQHDTDGTTRLACFVPAGQIVPVRVKLNWEPRCCNVAGVAHGLGDFLVRSQTWNGIISTDGLVIVNGLVFADTYDNRGWSKCLQQSVQSQLPSPVKLFNVSSNDSCDFDKKFMEDLKSYFLAEYGIYIKYNNPDRSRMDLGIGYSVWVSPTSDFGAYRNRDCDIDFSRSKSSGYVIDASAGACTGLKHSLPANYTSDRYKRVIETLAKQIVKEMKVIHRI